MYCLRIKLTEWRSLKQEATPDFACIICERCYLLWRRCLSVTLLQRCLGCLNTSADFWFVFWCRRSRQHVIREPTLEWIERYYSGIFKEVHFGNHFALEGSARPKSEICRYGAHRSSHRFSLWGLSCLTVRVDSWWLLRVVDVSRLKCVLTKIFSDLGKFHKAPKYYRD